MAEPKKIPREELIELLKDAISDSADVKFIEGDNPCLLRVGDDHVYVYLKNLTPAQLSNNNEDVWRVQLPKRKVFEDIKLSPHTFVFLGYDANFDVYATWDPYWTKQRLNVGESVSFYSRLSYQKNATTSSGFTIGQLNHNASVILFTRGLLADYLLEIKEYFPEETTYVAIGSSLRKGVELKEPSNFDFDLFISLKQIQPYTDYIRSKVSKQHTVKNYVFCLKYLFENELFKKHREYFDCVSDESSLKIACRRLLLSDDIKAKDTAWHGGIKAALNHYIRFFCGTDSEKSAMPEVPKLGEIEESKNNSSISSDLEKYAFIEDITNKEIISKIISLLDDEAPDEVELLTILSDYYGDKYNDQMTFGKWLDYIFSKDWKTLYGSIK